MNTVEDEAIEREKRNCAERHEKELKLFWNSIWFKPAQHKNKAHWIQEEEDSKAGKPKITTVQIKTDRRQLRGSKTENTRHIATHFTKFLRDPQIVLIFLTQAVTPLLQKESNPTDPDMYRPSTCLCTL
ncbi:hypothetical protein ABEB36_014860 [Hypothenemus hampei]|uniref:Uncharacterized protein n=1 Tax=Hypothenemus hampei TaxID=57062 RepID=A0ABD1E1Z1_HYPHA